MLSGDIGVSLVSPFGIKSPSRLSRVCLKRVLSRLRCNRFNPNLRENCLTNDTDSLVT